MIGGEFEFTSLPNVLSNKSGRLTQGNSGTWSTNGRAALYLILQKLKSKGVVHVHLPAFLCQSILQPVIALEMDYSFYPVKTDMTVPPDPPSNSAVLLIHNFGLINDSVSGFRNDSSREYELVEDASHVFLNDNFFNDIDNQYVFFSVRKHAPTILGGWCNLNLNLNDFSKDVELNIYKSLSARLIKGIYLNDKKSQIDLDKEEYYLNVFREIENTFNSDICATSIPQYIMSIINSFRWNEISRIRRSNWKILHELIGNKVEPLFDKLPKGVVPLGYVIRTKNRDIIKEKLAQKRIFAPVHWRLPSEVNKNKFPDAVKLSDTVLTLPIDQRYGLNDMVYISNSIKEIL